MSRKLWALCLCLTLLLPIPAMTVLSPQVSNADEGTGIATHVEGTSPGSGPSPSPSTQGPWWERYARDKDRDGVSDLLIWKLEQGARFYPAGQARVFVRYDHHPTDADVAAMEAAGAEITLRARYLDLLGTTMPRDLIPRVANWPGVVMLDDIPKAETHMHEAVPVMGVDQVWETYGIDGEGITVAVVDTGVDGQHLGLDDMDDDPLTDDPKILVYYNAYDDQEYDGRLSEDSGTHGSHVAGIVAGTGDGDTAPDGSRYIGVAPGANLVNVLTCCTGDVDDIIRGIEWTITNQDRFNIRVMTSSLGEQQVEFHIDNDGLSAWSQAVDAAMESGIIVTLSAGNEFGAATGAGCNTIDSPGDARNPITVAALDKDLSLAYYSSRGYTSDGRVKPDVATPGTAIMAPNKGTGTGYTAKSGTSMATPFMAGIAALTLQANPSLTPQEFKETMVGAYSINREVWEEGDFSNDCSAAERGPDLEAIPDNEYGYGQADTMTFVEVAGMIDPDLQVEWDLEPDTVEVNGTLVEVQPEVYNGTWLTGSADNGGLDVTTGVQIRIGASDWVMAEDTSSGGDWSSWKVQMTPENGAYAGNQTLWARLVVDDENMSAVDTVSIVLLDERAPVKDDDSPAPGLLMSVLMVAGVAVAVAWRRGKEEGLRRR